MGGSGAAAARLDSVSEGESSSAPPAVGTGRKTSAVIKETGTSVSATNKSSGGISSTTSSTSSGASSMPSVSGGGPGGGAYGYHHSQDDEESAFEKSMDSLENMNPLQFEVLETTV